MFTPKIGEDLFSHFDVRIFLFKGGWWFNHQGVFGIHRELCIGSFQIVCLGGVVELLRVFCCWGMMWGLWDCVFFLGGDF